MHITIARPASPWLQHEEYQYYSQYRRLMDLESTTGLDGLTLMVGELVFQLAIIVWF